MSGATCPWCGNPLRGDSKTCRYCGDLDGAQQSLLEGWCTRTADCPAAADRHEDDCPVEIELLRVIGF